MKTLRDRGGVGSHPVRTTAERSRKGATLGQFASCLLVVLVLAATSYAQIQVDCDTPDDFCTGDPCVTPDQIEVTVASCVLDFGSRALVIAESVEVPNDGILSLTAGSIEVQRRIRGRHTRSGAGDGADVSLIASGDVIVRRSVDVSGRATNGSIVIDAGGNVALRQILRARGMGAAATATGGTVTIDADEIVSSTLRGKIDARGRNGHTAGGQVSIDGASGVDLAGRIDVRGTTGGNVSITSSNGNVKLGQRIRANGAPGSGGAVAVEAQGDVTASFKAPIEVDGKLAHVGVITFSAAGAIDVDRLTADSISVGGTISLVAGTVSARSLRARGRDLGGTITVESTVGTLAASRLNARATQAAGGSITLTSATDLTVMNGTANVDGDLTGGEIRFTCNGDMVIFGGSFSARGDTGGTIQGIAGGNLLAQATFQAKVGGCVGLSAGGTVNTGVSSFDVPLTASCP